MNDRFAYGYDRVEGHGCPAYQADYPEPPEKIRVVDDYDDILSEQRGDREGVVDETEARLAWLKAIQKLEDNPDVEEEEVEAGREIAEDLDWL